MPEELFPKKILTVQQVLERKYTWSLILLIHALPGRSQTFYTSYYPGGKRTKYTRLVELEQVGLLTFDEKPRRSNTKLVRLTRNGEDVAAAVLAIAFGGI